MIVRCPFATWDPAPAWKHYPDRNTAQGEVKHSMVGTWTGARGRLMGPDQASWHFSVLQDGRLIQHYDVDVSCWHAGGWWGNTHLIGVEHEGGASPDLSEPLTPAQLATTIRLSCWLRDTVPWYDYTRRVEAWEHNELSATACPSGRIPWEIIVPEVSMGMTVEERAEFDALKALVETLKKDQDEERLIRMLAGAAMYDDQARVRLLEAFANTDHIDT